MQHSPSSQDPSDKTASNKDLAESVMPTLITQLRDENKDVCGAALQALGQLVEKSMVEKVSPLLQEQSIMALIYKMEEGWHVWECDSLYPVAAQALSQLVEKVSPTLQEKIVKRLIAKLYDDHSSLAECQVAAEVLSQLVGKVSPTLQERIISSLASSTRLGTESHIARKVLAQPSKQRVEKASPTLQEQILKSLITKLKNTDSSTRKDVMERLGERVAKVNLLLQKKIFTTLITTLWHRDHDVRRPSVDLLIQLEGKVSPLLQEQILKALINTLRARDSEVRNAAEQVLGQLVAKVSPTLQEDIVRSLIAKLSDPDFTVRTSAVVVLSQLVEKVSLILQEDIATALINTWNDDYGHVELRSFVVQTAAKTLVKLVEVRPTLQEKIVRSLIAKLEDQYFWFVCQAAKALGQLGGKVSPLLQEQSITALIYKIEEGWHVWRCDSPYPVAAQALSQLVEKVSPTLQEKIVKSLIAKLYDDSSLAACQVAAEVLSQLVGKVSPTLQETIISTLASSTRPARKVLAQPSKQRVAKVSPTLHEQILKSLIAKLEDVDPSIKKDVMERLGERMAQVNLPLQKQSFKQIFTTLITLLWHRDHDVRGAAVEEALSQLGEKVNPLLQKQILKALINTLRARDSEVREAAQKVLSQLGEKVSSTLQDETVKSLIAKLSDPDVTVRNSVVVVLSQLGEKVSPPLQKKIITGLTFALSDRDSYLRRVTAQLLSQLLEKVSLPLQEQIVTSLMTTVLKDRDSDVCRVAAEVLVEQVEKISLSLQEEIVTGLTSALRDRNFDVRRTAVRALSQLGEKVSLPLREQIVTALIPTLEDEDNYEGWDWYRSCFVRQDAAEVLGQLGDKVSPPPVQDLRTPAQSLGLPHSVATWHPTTSLPPAAGALAPQLTPAHEPDEPTEVSLTSTMMFAQIQYDDPTLPQQVLAQYWLPQAWALGGKALYQQAAALIDMDPARVFQAVGQYGSEGALLRLTEQGPLPDFVQDTALPISLLLSEPIPPSDPKAVPPPEAAAATSWAMPGLQTLIHAAGLSFKGLDTVVDGLRFVDQPTFMHAKTVLLDTTQCYGLYMGVNRYTMAIHTADVVGDLYHGDYTSALHQGWMTLATFAFPWALYQAGVPGTLYGLLMTAYTGYHAISNAYTFYQEQGTSPYQTESLRAYGELSKKLADSPLQGLYDFSPWVEDYKEALDHQVEVNEGVWDQGEDWGEGLFSPLSSPLSIAAPMNISEGFDY